MSPRGGTQRIPRPAGARPGGPPPWAGLPSGTRGFTLAEVRVACASLPPPRRPELVAPGSREAAVVMVLFEERGEARVVLTKRTESMPSHRGEIVFPGGSVRSGVDETPVDAALREACEEIGLAPDSVEVVAELDALATVASRFTITPFVGMLTSRPELTPDPAEVAAILDVRLGDLLHEDSWREEWWPIGGADRPVYFFELPGETVWGATARILTDFLALLTTAR